MLFHRIYLNIFNYKSYHADSDDDDNQHLPSSTGIKNQVQEGKNFYIHTHFFQF